MQLSAQKHIFAAIGGLIFTSWACTAGGGDAQGTADALVAQLTALSVSEAAPVEDTSQEEAPATEVEADTPVPTATEVLPTATNVPPPDTQPPDTQPPPTDLPDWPVLSRGDTAPEVVCIKYLLGSHGYGFGGEITAEFFGILLRAQVKSFQEDKGLVVDGIVGPQTWQALITGKTIKQGNVGQATRGAQYILTEKFNFGLDVDGIFGPQTDLVVTNFQTLYALQVDGIVGPQTWQALIAINP